MSNFLKEVFDWSEVWAPLIPLVILFFYRRQPRYVWPVITYLILAFFIDLVIDAGWKFKSKVPEWLKDNNFLYNVHSVIRFVFFVAFFQQLRQPFLPLLKKLLPYFSLLFLVINFGFMEAFFQKTTFSSRLLATEAGLLLFYCLCYFLYKMQEEQTVQRQRPDFWIVMGLSIYVVSNFSIFLYYQSLIDRKAFALAESLWNIHNATFIILCGLIGVGLTKAQESYPETTSLAAA